MHTNSEQEHRLLGERDALQKQVHAQTAAVDEAQALVRELKVCMYAWLHACCVLICVCAEKAQALVGELEIYVVFCIFMCMCVCVFVVWPIHIAQLWKKYVCVHVCIHVFMCVFGCLWSCQFTQHSCGKSICVCMYVFMYSCVCLCVCGLINSHSIVVEQA
jgi:hypothetical protein